MRHDRLKRRWLFTLHGGPCAGAATLKALQSSCSFFSKPEVGQVRIESSKLMLQPHLSSDHTLPPRCLLKTPIAQRAAHVGGLDHGHGTPPHEVVVQLHHRDAAAHLGTALQLQPEREHQAAVVPAQKALCMVTPGLHQAERRLLPQNVASYRLTDETATGVSPAESGSQKPRRIVESAVEMRADCGPELPACECIG